MKFTPQPMSDGNYQIPLFDLCRAVIFLSDKKKRKSEENYLLGGRVVALLLIGIPFLGFIQASRISGVIVLYIIFSTILQWNFVQINCSFLAAGILG